MYHSATGKSCVASITLEGKNLRHAECQRNRHAPNGEGGVTTSSSKGSTRTERESHLNEANEACCDSAMCVRWNIREKMQMKGRE